MLNISYQTAKGTAIITKPNGDEEVLKVDVPMESVHVLPMANVGVSINYTKNLGNYENIKFGISLYLPSQTDEKSVNTTFIKAKEWCTAKLEDLVESAEG